MKPLMVLMIFTSVKKFIFRIESYVLLIAGVSFHRESNLEPSSSTYASLAIGFAERGDVQDMVKVVVLVGHVLTGHCAVTYSLSQIGLII